MSFRRRRRAGLASITRLGRRLRNLPSAARSQSASPGLRSCLSLREAPLDLFLHTMLPGADRRILPAEPGAGFHARNPAPSYPRVDPSVARNRLRVVLFGVALPQEGKSGVRSKKSPLRSIHTDVEKFWFRECAQTHELDTRILWRTPKRRCSPSPPTFQTGLKSGCSNTVGFHPPSTAPCAARRATAVARSLSTVSAEVTVMRRSCRRPSCRR
jgi:hypothetical protein